MDNVLKTDLYRYFKLTGIRGFMKAIIRIPGFRFTYFFRKASKHKKNSLRGLIYLLFKRRYAFKYGFQIPIGTKIGKGFFIGHFGYIVINENVVIGDYCNIAHGVTIGQASRGKRRGVPKLGDFVWIGTGAVIVGNVNIGSNVLIAPNTFVNFDVPDNSIVIGNPGKIIKKMNATKGYINNIFVLDKNTNEN